MNIINLELPEMSLTVDEDNVYTISIFDDACVPPKCVEQHVVKNMAQVHEIINNFMTSAFGDSL